MDTYACNMHREYMKRYMSSYPSGDKKWLEEWGSILFLSQLKSKVN